MVAAGLSDPFVQLVLNEKGAKKIKSKVIKKTLTPVWNETFYFEVANPATAVSCAAYRVLLEGLCETTQKRVFGIVFLAALARCCLAVHVSVWDFDLLKANDSLGSTQVAMSGLAQGACAFAQDSLRPNRAAVCSLARSAHQASKRRRKSSSKACPSVASISRSTRSTLTRRKRCRNRSRRKSAHCA